MANRETFSEEIVADCESVGIAFRQRFSDLDRQRSREFGFKKVLFRGTATHHVLAELRQLYTTERVIAMFEACARHFDSADFDIDDDVLAECWLVIHAHVGNADDVFALFKTIEYHEGNVGLLKAKLTIQNYIENSLNKGMNILKAKVEEIDKRKQLPTEGQVTNNFYASGNDSRINIHSKDESTNVTVNSAAGYLDELIELSKASGRDDLVAEAKAARASWPDHKSTSESVSKWVSIASGLANIMHQAFPLLQHIYGAIAALAK